MSNQESIPPPPRSTAELAGRAEDTERQPDQGSKSRDAGKSRDARDPSADERAPLLTGDRTQGFSSRWQDVQAKFVDEPQAAVREADGLVAEVMQTLATTFADQRTQLEGQWSRGSEVSTEDLRQALMQYRSFFQRLLAA